MASYGIIVAFTNRNSEQYFVIRHYLTTYILFCVTILILCFVECSSQHYIRKLVNTEQLQHCSIPCKMVSFRYKIVNILHKCDIIIIIN